MDRTKTVLDQNILGGCMPNRTSDDTLQTLRLMWAEQVILRQTQTLTYL